MKTLHPLFKTCFIFILLLFVSQTSFARIDSVGTIEIDGEKFILHEVEAKETLYSISKRYGVSIESIQKANNLDEVLKLGIIIRIPFVAYEKRSNNSFPNKNLKPVIKGKKAIYHVVQPEETLYRISVNKNVKVEEIKTWNNLPDNNISVGDSLIVGFEINKNLSQTVLIPDPISTENPTNKEAIDLKKPAPKILKEEKLDVLVQWDNSGNINPYKKFALHKTLPKGTIIKVSNKKNKRIVYVKVVGKLNEDSLVDLMISKSAAEQLNMKDKRFRGNLAYGIVQ